MNKIAAISHNLLQLGPEHGADPDDVLHEDDGEHLHDFVDQGLLIVVTGSVNILLCHAPHKEAQWVAFG